MRRTRDSLPPPPPPPPADPEPTTIPELLLAVRKAVPPPHPSRLPVELKSWLAIRRLADAVELLHHGRTTPAEPGPPAAAEPRETLDPYWKGYRDAVADILRHLHEMQGRGAIPQTGPLDEDPRG